MSRPFAFFSALRSTLPKRPLASSGFASRFGANAGAGPSRNASHHSSDVVGGGIVSTLFRPITLILICAPILTGYLGVWQIQRLKWKVALIEEVDRNLAKDPMVLPAQINLSALPDFAFRRVLLRGRFTGPALLQGPQTREGVPGYHLILPFDRSESGGTTILLNRGFIKTAVGDEVRTGARPVPGLGPNGEPSEEVVIEGLVTKADPNAKSTFTPDNKPNENRWYWKDIPAMAEDAGGESRNFQPVLIDAIDQGDVLASILMKQGEPVGRLREIELRNQHMTYAITWFSLCAATSVMLGVMLAKGRTKKITQPARRAFNEHRR